MTDGQRYRPTYIYPPLDKRYSPIISSICGPNKSSFDRTALVFFLKNSQKLYFWKSTRKLYFWKSAQKLFFWKSGWKLFFSERAASNFFSERAVRNLFSERAVGNFFLKEWSYLFWKGGRTILPLLGKGIFILSRHVIYTLFKNIIQTRYTN